MDKDGYGVKQINVYFYNEPLECTELSRVQLTNDKVIELVNEHWTGGCKDLGEKGQYVPCFQRVDMREEADVRVKYTEGKHMTILIRVLD